MLEETNVLSYILLFIAYYLLFLFLLETLHHGLSPFYSVSCNQGFFKLWCGVLWSWSLERLEAQLYGRLVSCHTGAAQPLPPRRGHRLVGLACPGVARVWAFNGNVKTIFSTKWYLKHHPSYSRGFFHTLCFNNISVVRFWSIMISWFCVRPTLFEMDLH